MSCLLSHPSRVPPSEPIQINPPRNFLLLQFYFLSKGKILFLLFQNFKKILFYFILN